MKQFRLLGTTACHLCELAESLVAVSLGRLSGVEVEVIDISESDALFEGYGLVIPVLQHPDGRELRWPFGDSEVREFLLS